MPIGFLIFGLYMNIGRFEYIIWNIVVIPELINGIVCSLLFFSFGDLSFVIFSISWLSRFHYLEVLVR